MWEGSFKPAWRECHKYCSTERVKGNINVDIIIKNKDIKDITTEKAKILCVKSSPIK